jgi:multisubunit Na+/H+ antiporter MnhG subunit
MQIAVAAFLGLAVLSAWIGVIGFARLRKTLDRVHCVTFVNTAAGAAMLIAALLNDGPSDRVFKISLIFVVNLLSGAAVSHMTGRAITQRDPQT